MTTKLASALSVDDYETLIIEWAHERGIIAAADPRAQLLKTLEELGETAGALAKGQHDQLLDGIGDVLVTLAIFANLSGFTLVQAVEAAWHEIAERKGRTVDGVFVKDA